MQLKLGSEVIANVLVLLGVSENFLVMLQIENFIQGSRWKMINPTVPHVSLLIPRSFFLQEKMIGEEKMK